MPFHLRIIEPQHLVPLRDSSEGSVLNQSGSIRSNSIVSTVSTTGTGDSGTGTGAKPRPKVRKRINPGQG